MPITIKQKKQLFEALKTQKNEDFTACLIAAIQKGLTVPIISDKPPLNKLVIAYKACKFDTELQNMQLDIIRKYVNKYGTSEFTSSFSKTFDENDWLSSDFLYFIADYFKVKLYSEPQVELNIIDGKVNWRLIKDKEVLYNNHMVEEEKENNTRVSTSGSATIIMSWEQFRLFKDAGKRGSSVSISKEILFNECSKQDDSINESACNRIWQELKDKGLLDKNYRLSHLWISHSGNITLDEIKNMTSDHTFTYTKLATVLNKISQDSQYSKRIGEKCYIFRPSRSLKRWGLNHGYIQNYKPKENGSEVQEFDVSNYKDLINHAVTEDDLEHDHIPSANHMRHYQDKELETGNITKDQKLSSHQMGTIELNHSLHTRGITYQVAKEKQLKMDKPFYEEVDDYLYKLKSDGQGINEYIKAIGAFRYLYRCQVKQKFSSVSTGFFSNKQSLRQDIDQLLTKNLKDVIALT